MRMDREPHIGEYDMNATEEKAQRINDIDQAASSVPAPSGVNGARTGSKGDTPLTHGRSSKVPTDPTRFKTWADAACGSWPVELTVQAAKAADRFKYDGMNDQIMQFVRDYEAWRTAVDAEDR
jgi:hypothetical protein